MDRIEKFVNRLNAKWAKKVRQALVDIVLLNLKGYQIKKLSGANDVYRLRLGSIRIVFKKLKDQGGPMDIFYRGRGYR